MGRRRRATQTLGAWRSDGAARWLFVWPAVLLILALSIFPLVASVALSVSRLVFNPGHVDLSFIGFSNYQQLLFGLERSHFLGVLKPPNVTCLRLVREQLKGKAAAKEAKASASTLVIKMAVPGKDAELDAYLASLPEETLAKYGFDGELLAQIAALRA